MGQRHAHVRLPHDVADRDALREVPANLRKGLGGAGLPGVLPLGHAAGPVVAVVALQPAVVVGGLADARGEGEVGIAVAGHVQSSGAVAVDLLQRRLHLPEARHGADVGNLEPQFPLRTGLGHLVDGGKHLIRVVPQVHGDLPTQRHAAVQRRLQLPRIRTRHVAQSQRQPDAAARQRSPDPPAQPFDLHIIEGRIAIHAARRMPEELVSGKERQIHRRAVPIHQLQILHGIVHVQPAVAADGGGHAHAQLGQEDVRLYPPVRHRVLVHVDVDEARAHDAARRVDHPIRLRTRLHDPSIRNPQIPNLVHTVCGIDHPSILNSHQHFNSPPQGCTRTRLPRMVFSTAIRGSM